MKYYIIAGEASGDLHGGNLIRAIHQQDKQATIRCWGGDKMETAGATLVKHYRDLAFMGFIEVVKNLPVILRNIHFCKKDIAAFDPDVLVLIDYPGFNLTIAPWAKKKGFKVAYYISPQVWAWKEGRVKKMKECIDHMMVILPFEKDYYRNKWNWEVEYVGHPLAEVIDSFKAKPPQAAFSEKPIIALLPGSRAQEISKKLPVMLSVSKYFPNYQFVVAKAPGTNESFYQNELSQYPNVSWVEGQTYELLRQSKAALVTSGTATLETALFGVPEVVCYKGSAISYQIGKRLIKVKYISLVNLILDQPLLEELIQDELTTDSLRVALDKLLNDTATASSLNKGYTALRERLVQEGSASEKAGRSVVALSEKSTS